MAKNDPTKPIRTLAKINHASPPAAVYTTLPGEKSNERYNLLFQSRNNTITTQTPLEHFPDDAYVHLPSSLTLSHQSATPKTLLIPPIFLPNAHPRNLHTNTINPTTTIQRNHTTKLKPSSTRIE